MKNEVKIMLRRVISFDIMVGSIIALIIHSIADNYSYVFLTGLIIAIINFIINSTIVNNTMDGSGKGRGIIILGFLFRILLVGIIAIPLVKLNKYNILPYVLGYSSQFIGLLIYGITINKD